MTTRVLIVSSLIHGITAYTESVTRTFSLHNAVTDWHRIKPICIDKRSASCFNQ